MANATIPEASVPLPPSPPKKKQKLPKSDKTGVVQGRKRAKELVAEPVRDSSYIPPWAWSLLAEPEASNCPPIFTKDSKFFFSAASTSVKIYSVSTGQIVSTLTPPEVPDWQANDLGASTNLVTAMFLNPLNPFQLYTGTAQGHIRLWDFLDAVLLQTFDVRNPITHVYIHRHHPTQVFFVGQRAQSKKSAEKPEGDFAVFHFTIEHKPIFQRPVLAKIGSVRKPTGMTISPSGTWLVVTGGKKAYVARTNNLAAGFTKFISPEVITCLAFHPTDELFATGDECGVIRLWYCLDAERMPWSDQPSDKKAPTTTLHWHAHAVSSVSFTPNGAYLLSGGEEATLVLWQLATGHREYIPRVGAPISSIVVAPGNDAHEQEYLLGLNDGTMLLIGSSSLKITKTFVRVKLASQHPSTLTTDQAPLAVHPSTSHFILPSSHPSTLQIYSSHTSTLISELEVSPSNRVSRRDDTPIESARVSFAVVCPGKSTLSAPAGEWMATVDYWDGGDDFGTDITLKIWRWEGPAGFVLNTRIDRPHEQSKITSVSFNPASSDEETCILVTTGDDGFTRTWGVRTVTEKNGEHDVFWTPRSKFNYRGQSPSKATWSNDGSILIVASGPYVTLWDPASNTLINSLSCPEVATVFDVASIGPHGRYVAVSAARGIVLWDLVLGFMRWHFQGEFKTATRLIPHPNAETFALIHTTSEQDSKSSHVSIFGAQSSTPLREHTLPFELIAAVWYPTLTDKFSILAITTTWTSVLIGDEVHAAMLEGDVGRGIKSVAEERQSLFQDIFGRSAFTAEPSTSTRGASSSRSKTHWAQLRGINLDLLGGPSHLLPPIETLFSTLIGGVIEPTGRAPDVDVDNKIDPLPVVEEQDEVEDVEMEDVGTISTNYPSRVVDKEEMELFTSLFRKLSPTGLLPPPKRKPKAAGTPAHSNGVNGTNEAHASPKLSKPTPKVNGTPSQPPSPVEDDTKTGRKRKKLSIG